MHRRRFIETAALGALAFGLPAAKLVFGATIPPELARPGLLAMLGEAQVRAIGVRFRDRHPGEVETWSRSLPAGSDRLQRQVRDDFETGRTIVVDGWLLSITEARQSALFSLLHP